MAYYNPRDDLMGNAKHRVATSAIGGNNKNSPMNSSPQSSVSSAWEPPQSKRGTQSARGSEFASLSKTSLSGRGGSRRNSAGVSTGTYRPIHEDDIEVFDSTDFGASTSTRQSNLGSHRNGILI